MHTTKNDTEAAARRTAAEVLHSHRIDLPSLYQGGPPRPAVWGWQAVRDSADVLEGMAAWQLMKYVTPGCAYPEYTLEDALRYARAAVLLGVIADRAYAVTS